jgi:drug/metabolite transporter (DMT)-like permease
LSAPIAVATALAGALVFGISSVADQRSTKRVKTERALSPEILLDLVRQPLWLIAIAANVAGFALQVVALSFGSLAVVQPLLVFDLVFAVLIARSVAWDARVFPPGTKRWDPVLFAGVGAATAGVAGFLAVGQPSADHPGVGFGVLLPLAIGLVVVVGGSLAAAARSPDLRPLALALACGVCYGVAAFSVKLVTSEFGSGPAHVFTNWPIYVLAVVGPAGFILNQNAFQQGRILAPVQAIITTADPIISIALSVLWLGARLRGSPAQITGEVVFLLLTTAGIVTIADRAPSSRKAQPSSAALCGRGCSGTLERQIPKGLTVKRVSSPDSE